MMLVYPQLATGALTQFPVQKRRRLRTIVNTAADGTVVKLADPGAETVEWQLNYSGLTDAELDVLLQFYAATEGSLSGFTFLDPTANLLAWSDSLNNAVWTGGPFLTKTAGIADPVSGNDAWHIENAGAGAQGLSQTVAAPGEYLYCLSVFVKSAASARVTLLLGDQRFDQLAGTDWRRIACIGTGNATTSSTTFGIELEPGTAIDTYGLQTEPQASPSLYKPSTSGGCYEGARLRDDALCFTTSNVNCHSATVNIIHASHL